MKKNNLIFTLFIFISLYNFGQLELTINEHVLLPGREYNFKWPRYQENDGRYDIEYIRKSDAVAGQVPGQDDSNWTLFKRIEGNDLQRFANGNAKSQDHNFTIPRGWATAGTQTIFWRVVRYKESGKWQVKGQRGYDYVVGRDEDNTPDFRVVCTSSIDNGVVRRFDDDRVFPSPTYEPLYVPKAFDDRRYFWFTDDGDAESFRKYLVGAGGRDSRVNNDGTPNEEFWGEGWEITIPQNKRSETHLFYIIAHDSKCPELNNNDLLDEMFIYLVGPQVGISNGVIADHVLSDDRNSPVQCLVPEVQFYMFKNPTTLLNEAGITPLPQTGSDLIQDIVNDLGLYEMEVKNFQSYIVYEHLSRTNDFVSGDAEGNYWVPLGPANSSSIDAEFASLADRKACVSDIIHNENGDEIYHRTYRLRIGFMADIVLYDENGTKIDEQALNCSAQTRFDIKVLTSDNLLDIDATCRNYNFVNQNFVLNEEDIEIPDPLNLGLNNYSWTSNISNHMQFISDDGILKPTFQYDELTSANGSHFKYILTKKELIDTDPLSTIIVPPGDVIIEVPFCFNVSITPPLYDGTLGGLTVGGVGVPDPDEVEVIVYPNPADFVDEINILVKYVQVISQESRTFVYEILKYDGTSMLQDEITTGTTKKVEIEGFSPGMYYLRLYDNGSLIQVKQVEIK